MEVWLQLGYKRAEFIETKQEEGLGQGGQSKRPDEQCGQALLHDLLIRATSGIANLETLSF